MSMQFWFEFASTYSYPAALRIERAAAARNVRIAWCPFLLGPIFAAQGWGDSPFNLFPAKGAYMWRDLERLCEAERLPWRRPSCFPRSGLLAARLACVAEDEPWLPSFVRSVYCANFAEDRDITAVDEIGRLLTALDLPASTWLDRAQSYDAKARLRARTEEAQRAGLFGAPSFVVAGELFWGNDRLEAALDWAVCHGG
ncbi:MAG: 2-hydroxychromene-2-carboxylate isomerase [Rhodospirillales bacterium]|nr:2-hydroxychromene-2-carboxylate isomerase [Rhodospirillales bacterium]